MIEHSTEEHLGNTITLYYDEDPESPREWENLTTMLCSHRRYNLGDEHNADHDRMRAILNTGIDPDNPDDEILFKAPLNAYEHGNITVSLGSFSCPWDSGVVGVVVIYQSSVDRTGTPLDSLERQAKAEVDQYAIYLEGGVLGYEVTDADGEHLDSCRGFYSEEDALKDARSQSEWYHTKAEEARKDAELIVFMNENAI